MIKWQLNFLVVSFLPSPITHSIAYKTLTWAMNDFTIAERSDAPEHWLWHQQHVPQTMRIGLQEIIRGEVSWYSSEQAIVKSAWICWLHLPGKKEWKMFTEMALIYIYKQRGVGPPDYQFPPFPLLFYINKNIIVHESVHDCLRVPMIIHSLGIMSIWACWSLQ